MWRQKGQDMIEYALMLALVVGIGGFIYTQGYGDNISAVFNNAGNLLEEANKTQEEAKKEADRNADRSYAYHLGELLKNAVTNGSIKLGDGSSVYLLVQNEPNSKYHNLHMNGAKTGDKVWIKNANGNLVDYGNAGFNTMLDTVGGNYQDAAVKQDGVYWYGVQIKKDGDGYTLSYMDSNTNSYINGNTGFDINQANEPYKTENWKP
ncbi:Flp family type IVb pilin [uncultured Dialister sp.]|uniref:Flp family type IVb pilin n=1 Tax=uncultured Dialister sp. TaxID=278064 RepID=UPI00262DE2D4|nr:hypothetical protein [uncultured Dialister sp.]